MNRASEIKYCSILKNGLCRHRPISNIRLNYCSRIKNCDRPNGPFFCRKPNIERKTNIRLQIAYYITFTSTKSYHCCTKFKPLCFSPKFFPIPPLTYSMRLKNDPLVILNRCYIPICNFFINTHMHRKIWKVNTLWQLCRRHFLL